MTQQGSRVGQQLGNYRLERLLGQGGFAEVYLGRHQRLQRQAAIKVLHAHLSQQEVEAFQREAQIIAALDHPHIVQIFDFDVQQGVPFLVMDYLPHGTLRQRHGKGEHVPLATVVVYVKQIADALQYAHDQRLMHRDVKPENMLIGRRSEIVLSDFGIAAIVHGTSSMTHQSTAGTIYYMAPEQIQSHARPASDQYALAVVVYEWLSGQRPFEGSYTEIFAKHLMTAPPSLREKLPDLSPEVEQVIFTALAKEQGQRFGSVQAFATALEAASQPALTAVEETFIAQPALPPPSPVLTTHTTPVPTNLATPVAQESAPAIATLPPDAIPPAKRPSARKISRRTVVTGLVALEVLALGGGIAWVGLSSYPPYVYRGHSNSVHAVAWSPNGMRIASGSADNTVQVWNAADGSKVFIYKGHSNSVDAVAWSPDGTRIASGSNNDTIVQVWNAADGSHAFTYKGHFSSVNAVAWSPNGTRIASGSGDSTVQVWNAADGSHVFTYKERSMAMTSVAWSPDSTRIASGNVDNTVQVWNAADGSHAFTYQGHSSYVKSVAWSPDGTRIASGSSDKTVQVWNAADGSHVFTYQGHASYVYAVAWSPDGTRIASGCDDNTVQVWRPQ